VPLAVVTIVVMIVQPVAAMTAVMIAHVLTVTANAMTVHHVRAMTVQPVAATIVHRAVTTARLADLAEQAKAHAQDHAVTLPVDKRSLLVVSKTCQ
jgi:hypothetical protein